MCTTTKWSSAAEQYDQAETARRAEFEQRRKEDEERWKQRAQQEAEIKEAAKQLEEWMRSDGYQAALRLLRSGSESWPLGGSKSVSLGKDVGEPTAGWSVSTPTRQETREGPRKVTYYDLTKDGFEKWYFPFHATYHGEFEAGDSVHAPASPEEVVRVVVASHGKKPSEVLAFIRAGLDEIAKKAPNPAQA